MTSMDARERWRVGLAVLTAFVGPAERRASDITAMAGDLDSREVLFGVLAVARDLLLVLEDSTGAPASELLQALAEGAAETGDE